MYVPVLKLFQTTHTGHRNPDGSAPPRTITDDRVPIILSGPKSRYGLGIGLHFIIMPEHETINVEHIWKLVRSEMRTALMREGLEQQEAEVFGWRLINPLNPPVEVTVEYESENEPALLDFRRLVTYQLLRGQDYDGELSSLKSIYKELAETFTTVLAGKPVKSPPEAARLLEGVKLQNLPIILRQEDIEKHGVLDIESKTREITRFLIMFTEKKYLKRVIPHEVKNVQKLYH
jgi:hypothetical protein